MNLEILLRYLHFISLFGWVSALVAEHLLLKKEMTALEIKRLRDIDGIYGLSAILVIGAGLTLWFGVGKPADFYTYNYIFHTKVTLAVLVGLLSIYPTVFYFRQAKKDPSELIQVPTSVKMMVRVELALTFLIPLLATLMAKGVGYFGS